MGTTRKPRLYGHLTPLAVRRLSKAGYHADGAGLYLQVLESGARSWVLKYTLFGRKREMGLGSCKTYTIDEAREKARKYRQLVDDGIDPIAQRDQRRRRGAPSLASARRLRKQRASTSGSIKAAGATPSTRRSGRPRWRFTPTRSSAAGT